MAKQGQYLSNLLKAMVCECFVNNPDLTFAQIAKMHNIHHTLVSKILKAYCGDSDFKTQTILSTWETD
jgi:hypothetical protein